MKQPPFPHQPSSPKKAPHGLTNMPLPEPHERVVRMTRATFIENRAPIGLTDAPSSDFTPANTSAAPKAHDDMLSLGKAVHESDEQLIASDEIQTHISKAKPDDLNLLKICPEFTLTGEKPMETASTPADANRTGRRHPLTTRRRRPLLPPPKPSMLDEFIAWIAKKLQ